MFELFQLIFPSRRQDGCKGSPPFSVANAPCAEVTALTPVPSLVQLVKTAELDPRQNYLVGFHPHGVLAVGAFINFGTEATGFSTIFPGITPHLMMLSLWFRVPFLRDYLMSGGKQDGSTSEWWDEWVNQMFFGEQRGKTSGRPEKVKESLMSSIYRRWIRHQKLSETKQQTMAAHGVAQYVTGQEAERKRSR